MAAAILVAGFAVRARRSLRPALVPCRLLVFVTGLFLVVQTIGRHGLDEVTGALIGGSGRCRWAGSSPRARPPPR